MAIEVESRVSKAPIGAEIADVTTVLGNIEATLRLHYDGRTDVGRLAGATMVE